MTKDGFNSGAHVVYDLHVHLVLTAKYRRKVMTERVTAVIGVSFREVCVNLGCELIAFETDGDHAHLLVTYPPKLAISKLVGTLKSVSATRVREQHWPEVTRALYGAHFWSPSYAAISAGGAPLELVKAYVENQQNPNRVKHTRHH